MKYIALFLFISISACSPVAPSSTTAKVDEVASLTKEKTKKEVSSNNTQVSDFMIWTNSIKKDKGEFRTLLGLTLGDGYKQVKQFYPEAFLKGERTEKQCGGYSAELENGLHIQSHYHEIVSLSGGIRKIKKGVDIFNLMNSFINKHGKPDIKRLSKDRNQIYLEYITGDTDLALTIRAEPEGLTDKVYWTYQLSVSYISSVYQSFADKGFDCEAKVNPPYIGDCVKFVNTGQGLLNKGDKITTTGRVTMKSAKDIFVYITDIDGSKKLLVDGKSYWKKDEIAVPYWEVKSCN